MDTAAVDSACNQIDAAVAAGKLSADGKANLQRWLTQPQFQSYQPQLLELVAGGEFEALDRLFWQVIPFGTGGRRGEMAAIGSATINPRTIAESAHGLAVYLKSQQPDQPGRAVVAHDTRHRSVEFAQLTATTLAAHGLHVFCFESHRSTPELSFALRQLKCDVGVMITASHNPPSDNGFKAYWSHGGQVLPPHDRGIIECVYDAGEIPARDFAEAVAAGEIEILGNEIDRAYVDEVVKLSLSHARSIPAIFTPLHGVGETSVWEVLTRAGFQNIEIFEPHRTPDGDFSNVPDQLPNPERPEVFAPVIERAREMGAKLILASDPDADRLGMMVHDHDGQFKYLTGNRIGALLADFVLRKRQAQGTLSPDHYVVETLVTTPLISAVARSFSVRAIDDLLVGFKYIAQTMDREGPEKFVFGAEESIGYLAGEYARDKDAAVAALYAMELASELQADGQTLWDRLDELFVAHGYFEEGQLNEYCRGPRGKLQIDELMEQLRTEPPHDLAGLALVRVRDFGRHEIRELPANLKSEELPEPQGDLLMFESAAEGGCSVTFAVRPSGTEPKIKFYFFGHADVADAGQLAAVKERTRKTLQRVQQALSTWVQTQWANG